MTILKTKVKDSEDDLFSVRTTAGRTEMAENAPLTREEVAEKIIGLIHDSVPKLENEELTEESILSSDTGIDSMDFILVLYKVEGEFSLKIPKEEWEHYTRLGDLVDGVLKYKR